MDVNDTMKIGDARRVVRARLQAAGAILVLAPVAAATAADGAFYVSASAVRTVTTLSTADVANAAVATVAGISGTTLAVSSSSSSLDSPVGWTAGVGYRIGFFGIEASYLDLGRETYKLAGTETAASGPSSLTSTIQVGTKGPALALVGYVPLLDSLQANIRIGAFGGKTSTDYSNLIDSIPHTGSVSKTTTSALVGIGLDYAVTGHLSVDVNFLHLNRLREQFLVESYNVNLATAGLTYAF